FALHLYLHDPPTTAIYTLSLHDALPIFHVEAECGVGRAGQDRQLGIELELRGRRLPDHDLERQIEAVGAARRAHGQGVLALADADRKSTRLNSSHVKISYAVFCLKKKNR